MRVLSWDVAVKSLSYCILDYIPSMTTICAWETINVYDEGDRTCAKPTIKDDSEAVLDALIRRRDVFYRVPLDAVIVECQPGSLNNRFSNMKMKVLSHDIHAFFYTIQRMAGSGLGGNGVVIPVMFVSPNSKLTGMVTESSEDRAARQQGDRRAMGAKYRANKKYAVDTTTALLDQMDSSLLSTTTARAVFHSASKKDDLADSLMLAYAFATKSESVAIGVRKRKCET